MFDESGRPVHRRGVTESPGLYFLGLSWQHTRGSALLGWVKDDAEHIAGEIGSFRRRTRRTTQIVFPPTPPACPRHAPLSMSSSRTARSWS